MADNAQAQNSASAASSAEAYLSRPATAANTSAAFIAPTSKSNSKHETRLYVGNLHTTVDEYTLIQTFSKFGKISKLDFLFHKSGPQRGQPRGYAFVEYASPQEAMQAVVGAHDKTLRGRRISVTFASKSTEGTGDAGGVGPHRRDRRAGETEAVKTTQLSLAKNAKQPQGTNAKIAAMEAKLAKLRQVKTPPASASSSAPTQARSGLASLPAKPTFRSPDTPQRPATQARQHQR
ncbi:RNA recognition motif domain protein [Kalmanozyma brasiliensis GHG001]|uniref:RNA recognition motif domain protein n=1 Tax=Kalmanozyma brasiliensis (strain GHG001) TaxID=1365824 RepID=UPI0028681F87|nr:RNA recognition motif domain protein [Kalmanozyma brasiliensis GHG001]KAF6766934.1 RNA recognition motif domain protein [Kalmanozyma brasiliensis GHG001]